MDKRLELHEILAGILGSRNVYFQPPSNQKMNYPAIRYTKRPIKNKFANNSVYKQSQQYEITVIDYDPDSVISKRISKLPTANQERSYTSDNLNHDVFTIYY